MSESDVTAAAVSMDAFSLWNAKLLETFFSSACDGDEVWLQLDGHELDLIGPELGGEEGFLKAVRAGPAWDTFRKDGKPTRGHSADLMQRVTGLVHQRLYPARKPSAYVDPGTLNPMYRGCKAPTYLPFLAALVRSSALETEGFYKHLREALHLPEYWNSLQLEKLELAWDDLQDWTKETKGRFGRFVLRRLGAHAHVGIPRSQCIMSRHDCKASGRVFKMARLRRGQRWTPEVASEVIAYASDILSASFRDALTHPELRGPIQASLRSLFDEWDGTDPGESRQHIASDGHDAAIAGQVQLSLSLTSDASRWQVHWRVPPSREGSETILARGGISWRAPAWGTEQCGTLEDASAVAADASRKALSDSATQEVYFDARLEEDGSEPASLGRFVLPRSELRVLVWGVDYARQREELQEHPLPRHGCAYLLATQRVANDFLAWLERSAVDHEIIDIDGLPPGWILACLIECNALTEAHVQALPGFIDAPQANRVLAFVGGRSVSRASKRQYLSYDLPTIELDAPRGTRFKVDAGLFLDEAGPALPGGKFGVRRFKVSLGNTAQRSFTITAVHGARELATVTLRVAPDSGEQVALGKDFSLDRQGNPQGASTGLRGALSAAAMPGTTAPVSPSSIAPESLGERVHPGAAEKLSSNPAAQFLDSLTRQGSMAFGTAKDQLYRLLAASRDAPLPEHVLLDLRCRGHIEIETTTRGHFARIHAVRPALYRLPLAASGQGIYAMLGTPSLQQWRTLFHQAGAATIYQLPAATGLLPTWRVLASDVATVDSLAHASGMESLPVQSVGVASWAASCDDVREQVEQGAVESIGALEHRPHRLHAGKGCFMEEARSLRPQSACDLFRMDDRDIDGGRVYILATQKENVARYGFVRDSRWGVWIALQAFARYVKETYSIGDACPWPIPYSAKDGIVLLPARINLPVVLERALVLCSGQAPEVVEAYCRSVDGHCVIVRRSDGIGLAVVSQVYTDMACGKWLFYRSVPGEVAAAVAAKLGASLAKA